MAKGMCPRTAGSPFENRPTSILPSGGRVSSGLLQASRTRGSRRREQKKLARVYASELLLPGERNAGRHHIPAADGEHELGARFSGLKVCDQFALFAGHQGNIVVVPENRHDIVITLRFGNSQMR